MIPNTHPYVAWYTKQRRKDYVMSHRPVVAWNEDGQPLVVDEDEKADPRLVPARSIPGFDGLTVMEFDPSEDNFEIIEGQP